ncbi:MAG: hypothetical protein HY359_01785 [Candidatus Rokubacteria bacterium]|nr:hypothetical protein [Candidatus Rokubacteria bacterium]
MIWLFLLFAALGLGACGGRKVIPPLSAIVDAPLLRPGSSWTYRVTDSTVKDPYTLPLTFEKEDVYKNSAVLAFTTGGETIYYDRDLNFVAVVGGGKVLREASPSYRAFDFPFYVGKEWRAVFTFQDYVRTLSWVPVEVFWKVKEYDLVKVPAGEFRAFHLVSDPSTNWGLEEELWYAPEVKQVVKWKHDRTSAHYLGKGRQTGELLQYVLR